MLKFFFYLNYLNFFYKNANISRSKFKKQTKKKENLGSGEG